MQRNGRCLCGAVSFEADVAETSFGACHCEECRRWTGGPLMSLTVADDEIAWVGTAHEITTASSDWATRSNCGKCGSPLYFRMNEGPFSGAYHIPIGLIEDTTGLTLKREVFIDQKPDAYALLGDTVKMTKADILARFANQPGDGV